MDPTVIFDLLKGGFTFIQKYWKIFAILIALALAFLAVEHYIAGIEKKSYTDGYNAASTAFLTKEAAEQAAATAAMVAEQKQHQKDVDTANAAKDAAQQQAAANAVKRDSYYTQLQELQTHANHSYTSETPSPPEPQVEPSATAVTGQSNIIGLPTLHLNALFVGLYNLAIQAPDSGGVPSLAEVAQASRVDWASAPIDLSQPTSVTFDDVLDVNRNNMSVAQQCISDRALMNTYFNNLVTAGLIEQ